MYVEDVLDWIKIIFFSFILILCLIFMCFLFWNVFKLGVDSKLKNEAASLKTKLEIENLKLDNELKIIQLKELGFEFSEEEQIVED